MCLDRKNLHGYLRYQTPWRLTNLESLWSWDGIILNSCRYWWLVYSCVLFIQAWVDSSEHQAGRYSTRFELEKKLTFPSTNPKSNHTLQHIHRFVSSPSRRRTRHENEGKKQRENKLQPTLNPSINLPETENLIHNLLNDEKGKKEEGLNLIEKTIPSKFKQGNDCIPRPGESPSTVRCLDHAKSGGCVSEAFLQT